MVKPATKVVYTSERKPVPNTYSLLLGDIDRAINLINKKIGFDIRTVQAKDVPKDIRSLYFIDWFEEFGRDALKTVIDFEPKEPFDDETADLLDYDRFILIKAIGYEDEDILFATIADVFNDISKYVGFPDVSRKTKWFLNGGCL